MAPIIQIEELFGKRHPFHTRAINQFSRSPILIRKRHDAAWRAKQAHHRKTGHSKHAKGHHKSSKHSKHRKYSKHTNHHSKSSHHNKITSHQDKNKATLGHTPSERKEKSSSSKTEKKFLGGSNRPLDPDKGNDKAKEQKQTAPKLSPKAKTPISNGVPKIAPARASSGPSLAGTGGANTPRQGTYSSWSSLTPLFNNLPAQETPTSNPEHIGVGKVIGFSLVPLAAAIAVAYGVVVYRRRTNRRNHRRQVLLDAEDAAAAAAAARPLSDDDEGSLMSAVSYRPPAPFTSEVDVSTAALTNDNFEINGSSSLHRIPAPQRDASHSDNYQDYSHVCQSQILGQKCTNHSISCFVALNHSNAGLNVPESKTPAAYRPNREMSSAHVTLDSDLSVK